ncbi:MAG TPA: lysophospholipid acyltransferase family protein [Anaeromyxobacter sp.]
MLARIRGGIALVYAALSMAAIFFGSLPVMLVTGSGDLPIWLGRRLWGPIGLWLAGARLEVVRPPSPPPGPAIFVCNHESALDIWVVFSIMPRSFRFIAKQELYRLPIFGWYMRLGGHVPVDRSNHQRALASLAKAGETIRGGTSIVAFPEGTRSRTGRIQPFKKGAFVVAKEAGVPIIPIAISGTGAITPSKKIEIHPGTIRVVAGDPIDPAAFPEKERLLEHVRARIIELHLAAGGLGGEPAPGAGASARPTGA